MPSDLDLNAIAPAPPWLKPAIDSLRVNEPRGLAPLCDRELAAILLMALEYEEQGGDDPGRLWGRYEQGGMSMAGYIRGDYANAACDLLDELRRRGVRGAVGYRSRKRDRTLIVQTSDPADLVPGEWQGFKVIVEPPDPPCERPDGTPISEFHR